MTMQQFIEIEVVNQFGNNAVRPLCAIGETFADIAGTNSGRTATLTQHTLASIQELGYTIIYGSNDYRWGQVVENVADLFKRAGRNPDS